MKFEQRCFKMEWDLKRIVGIAALAAALAGCSGVVLNRGGYYAPVKAQNSPYYREQYRVQSLSPSYVTVHKGDTVYSLSRRYNVPIRSMIEVNNLKPPFILSKGARLRLPEPSVHVVQKGDTIYSISRRYNVDMSVLTRTNNLYAPYSIYLGQILKLPGSVVEPTERWVALKNTPAKTTVKKTAAKSAKSSKKTTHKTAARLPAPPDRAKAKFAWPVNGTVMNKFGSAGGGRHNDGINIKVAEGTFVRAAENGVVAYAGNELKGFGNLLLVKHADGWITAYAHNKEFLVKRGDTVKRGQPMAKAGKTGNAKEPQLHFEIRRGTKAVDPMNYLEKR